MGGRTGNPRLRAPPLQWGLSHGLLQSSLEGRTSPPAASGRACRPGTRLTWGTGPTNPRQQSTLGSLLPGDRNDTPPILLPMEQGWSEGLEGNREQAGELGWGVRRRPGQRSVVSGDSSGVVGRTGARG